MGFRTVVILCNDDASRWENDPELGKKISRLANNLNPVITRSVDNFTYGTIVEMTHADTQSLIMFDGYSAEHLAHGMWTRNESTTDTVTKLVRETADKLGYRLVRKSKKK